jgi:NhaA family Na+:H+ antiporter
VRPGETDPAPAQRHAVHALEAACEHVTQPLTRMEHALHPWVALGIMPVFALANAGVALGGGDAGASVRGAAALGAMAGLFLGKQIGVFAFSWLAVRAGVARLPAGATWRQLWGVACLCGIGFTMSLFIASLAFESPETLDGVKVAVLLASAASAALGAAILMSTRRGGPPA